MTLKDVVAKHELRLKKQQKTTIQTEKQAGSIGAGHT
jgi:hypothetical protein